MLVVLSEPKQQEKLALLVAPFVQQLHQASAVVEALDAGLAVAIICEDSPWRAIGSAYLRFCLSETSPFTIGGFGRFGTEDSFGIEGSPLRTLFALFDCIPR